MEVKAQIMKIGTPSATGRVYSREVMEEAIKKFNESQIKGGTLGQVGDLSHPVNLKDISHIFENVRIENDAVVADMKILNTPQGENVKTLLESDIKLALAPRLAIDEQQKVDENGNPVLDENGQPIMEVKSIELISCDIVQDSQKAFEGNTIKVEE